VDETAPARADGDAAVRLRLLGPLHLEVGGVDRTPPGPLLRVLLAVLGSARGEPVPVQDLAAALTQVGVESADTPPGVPAGGASRQIGRGRAAARPAGRPTGQDAVPVHVSRLRDLLGPAAGALVHTPFGYQLHGPDLRTDLDAVEACVRSARAATLAGDDTAAARALRRALDAWSGPVAQDLPDVPALASVRSRYQRLHRDLVEDLAEARLRTDSPGVLARCVSDLEEHLALHPARLRGWAILVTALHRAGRPAEALGAHRRALSALATAHPEGAHPPAEHDPVLRRLERAALVTAQGGGRDEHPYPHPAERVDGGRTGAQLPALVWLEPDGRSRVHSLPRTGSMLIGRQSGADVRLGDTSVSRAHAAVLRVDGGWTLLDLGSRGGTTLNGRDVTDGTPLRPGDVVRCGGVVLLVSLPAEVLHLDRHDDRLDTPAVQDRTAVAG